MSKIKREDFPSVTLALIEKAKQEVSTWEERLETLEEKESPSEKQLELATRSLENWESILEALEEVQELLQDLGPAKE